jgi:outer membrane lipopolysaccharide assembly protein LptE/RlpB
MKFRILTFTWLALAATLFGGCAGYQLGDVKPGVYADIQKLHVPPFKNQTLEPRLSSLVTNAVITELQADGTYQVSTRESADAVLVGTIRRIEKRQLRAVRTDTLRSQELSLFLYVEFHLEDPDTGTRIDGIPDRGDDAAGAAAIGPDGEVTGARQGLVIGDTIQFVDPSFQVGERNAFAVVAEDVADKLVSFLANGW